MSELTLNRRHLVRAAAGAAAGPGRGAGAGASAARAASAHAAGNWWVTHKTDEEPVEEGVTVVNFIDGGAAIANDVNPPGSVSTGMWEDKGDGRFKATFWGAFPEVDGNPAGYAVIEPRGRAHGDEVSGTFTVTVYDTSDTELFSFTGTFEGTRL